MLLFLSNSLSWADVTQELLYKVSQDGADIGQRTVQITYIPASSTEPMGGKKIEFQSDMTLSIAGISIKYAQKGMAYFSSNRSSFVVSNQINGELVEFQGKKTAAGGWSVYVIKKGTAQKIDIPISRANNLSIEMFGAQSWYEDDFMDVLLIDGRDLFNVNSVCKDGVGVKEPILNRERVDRKISIKDKEFYINSVYTKEDILLYSDVSIQGVQFQLNLKTDLEDLYFGEIKSPGEFSGIEEKDL